MSWLYQPLPSAAPAAPDIQVQCQSGTLSLTGNSATTLLHYYAGCQSGTLSLTGSTATTSLREVAYCQPGLFLLGMQDARTLLHYYAGCQPGTLRLQGTSATITAEGGLPEPVAAQQSYIGGGQYEEPDPFEEEFDDDMEIIQLSMHFLARAA